MIRRETVWGDVWPFAYLEDKNGQAWKIIREQAGYLLMQNRAGQQASMLRPADTEPVVVLEMDFDEAMAAIYSAFPGAQIISDVQERTAH